MKNLRRTWGLPLAAGMVAITTVAASANGSGGRTPSDPLRPTIMEQAAAQAAQPPSQHPAPFQPAPPLSPRVQASTRTGTTPGPSAAQAPSTSGPTKEVFGFVNAGNIADPQVGYPGWNFSLLSTVAFFGLHVNSGDGTLVQTDTGWTEWNSADLTNLLTTAHANGVRVVVSIILQDFSGNQATMCAGLSHGATTISQVVGQVQAKGIDGVNLDYEGLNAPCGSSTTRAVLTSFTGQMRSALPAGSYLSIDTYASSAGNSGGFFDIPGLAPPVDSFFVMAYDMDQDNWQSAPVSCASFCLNPVAPLTAYLYNDTTTANQYGAAGVAGKTILGVPYYGRTSCVAPTSASRPGPNAVGTGSTVSPRYLDSASTSTTPGVSAYAAGRDVFDSAGQEPYATWSSSTYNCWRESYWDDPVSLSQKYALVKSANLRGVGMFTLDYGGGAPELWMALNQAFGFQSLGGTVTSGAAVAAWGPNRLDVFARGTDNTLQHKWWDGVSWHGWESLGGVLTAAPAAVSWASYRIDVFVRGTDNGLWHKWWDGSSWNGWEPQGGVLRDAPAVSSWASNRLDVFVEGTDSALYHKSWNGSWWSGWEWQGGVLTAGPAAVSWGQNRIDVFVRGSDNAMYHKWWDGSSWNGWEWHGGGLASGPSAASTAANRLETYVIGTDGAIYERDWTGGGWTGWNRIGGSWAAAAPAAVSQPGSGHVDVFPMGTDHTIWHASF